MFSDCIGEKGKMKSLQENITINDSGFLFLRIFNLYASNIEK